MHKLSHIINPYYASIDSDTYIAQPITFSSIKCAKDVAEASGFDIQLYTAQYPEDHSIIPDYFIKTRNLDRSVLDLNNFKYQRKLPVLKDILDRLYEQSDADYFIYTNVDIAVMPFFYLTISNIIEQGYDSFIINRRTISNKYKNVNDLYLMYAQIGESHLGFDCFIFKKDAYKNYNLGLGCIGTTLIGRILLVNLLCNAQNFKIFEDLHLTFHIGDDKVWKDEKYSDYAEHNLVELNKIITHYKSINLLPVDHPVISHFISNNNLNNWISHNKKEPKLTLFIKKLFGRY